MKRVTLLLSIVVLFAAATGELAIAQDDDGPQNTVVTVTSFNLPYGPERGLVLDWMEEYFFPGIQLNPHVLNFHLLFHFYGSKGDQVVMATEFADFADINADCGAPCDEYNDAHPNPEEGDEGYDDFTKGVAGFNKAFSKHSDQIYFSQSEQAVRNGSAVGNVGPDPDDEDDEDDD